MTATVAKLLAQKEELLRRLDEDNPGPNERAAIEVTVRRSTPL